MDWVDKADLVVWGLIVAVIVYNWWWERWEPCSRRGRGKQGHQR
jgi:hypothetical protein